MAPPAKRRRRNHVVPSSSPVAGNQDEQSPSRPTRSIMDLISSSPTAPISKRKPIPPKGACQAAATSTPPRAKTANFPHNAAPIYLPKQTRPKASSGSAGSSPEKSKGRAKKQEEVKSGDISKLFTRQAQRQQVQGTLEGIASRQALSTQDSNGQVAEDIDMISDDDEVFQVLAQPSSMVGQAAKKRAREARTFMMEECAAPSTSQKFMRKPKLQADMRDENDTRPWAERFAPANLEELAVHTKKVADVRQWLENVTNGRMRQRVLLLKGAAGTGKTTTVQLLAENMDCEVLEWRNPVGSIATSDGVQSMTAQFEEFLGRGGKFGQLHVFSSNEPVQSKPDLKPLDRRKRLILVEEFPNTFSKSSTALRSFRSTVLQYLASNTPSLSMMYDNNKHEPVTPVVMIVSETLLSTNSASADSFTAHRLLGPEILQHPGVGIIDFNSIAPTLLAKALQLIVQKESRKSGRRKTPGPLVLKKLGEVGDIRSAIGSLEFLCLRGDNDGDWGAKVAFGKSSKASKDQALTKMEEESLEMVTRREASLGIFHAVAKVVYNKRKTASGSEDKIPEVENLPEFLSLHSRPKRSDVQVEALIDETGTDTQTFIAALHENYVLSCDAPPTSFDYSSLDHVNGCIDALSDSDLLCPSWDGSFNSTGFGGGTGGRGTGGDVLRQDELAFQVAARGLLFWLPNPVTRKAPAAEGFRRGKAAEAHKMFYPTSLKLWRVKEEIEGCVDLWVGRLMRGETEGHLHSVTAGATAFARPKVGTVESWKNALPSSANVRTKKEDDPAPLIAAGTSARKEMLLERLPYMLHVARSRKLSFSTAGLKDIEKVVTFHGIAGPVADETAEDDRDDIAASIVGEEWATDKSGDSNKSPVKRRGPDFRGKGRSNILPVREERELKLVLSDDDIEDD